MYYEERIIDGRWMYRTTPNGEWRRMDSEMLMEKWNNLRAAFSRIDEIAHNVNPLSPSSNLLALAEIRNVLEQTK